MFSNMPVVLSRPEWSTQVLAIIEKKLLDKRIEVRTKAGTILSGLLHTSFIQEETRKNHLPIAFLPAAGDLELEEGICESQCNEGKIGRNFSDGSPY